MASSKEEQKLFSKAESDMLIQLATTLEDSDEKRFEMLDHLTAKVKQCGPNRAERREVAKAFLEEKRESKAEKMKQLIRNIFDEDEDESERPTLPKLKKQKLDDTKQPLNDTIDPDATDLHELHQSSDSVDNYNTPDVSKPPIQWDHRSRPKLEAILASKTRRDGQCALWTRRLVAGGYGQQHFQGGVYLAHRLAFMLRHGLPSLSSALYHMCAHGHCINPDHLTMEKNHRYQKRRH
jgi:hypothetical protein